MKYVTGDPWPEAEKLIRKDKRPCLVFDECSQYINQLVNDIRQNKRAVKVVPRGYGSNDKTADLRGDLIREIEYKSNAQSAYATGFENMCNRSYGGWKVVTRYVSEKSFDQEIRIVRIPNPDASLPDFDAKESDYSDARYWFLMDTVPRSEYKRKYPNAKITDFSDEHYTLAPAWVSEKQVQVAEYWCVEEEKRKLLNVNIDGVATPMFEDELPDGYDLEGLRKSGKIKSERDTYEREVVQYITNGIEILEKNPQPGKFIPIVWLTGKELYVDTGAGPKRMLMSLIRLARDPQMLLNYYRTTQAEIVAMVPKSPYMGVTGQFERPEDWQAVNQVPMAFLEYNAHTDATGEAVLGPPVRPPFVPEIQELEIGAEAARRAIQSAMGLSSLPTNAQRLNDKSGVALKEIDENEDRGSFHFIDNYEMALEYSGRIINDLIPYIYDAPREVGVRNAKDEHRTVKVNQQGTNEEGQPEHNDLTSGEHEVTISTGPSYQSEREAADEFVKTIVPELEGLELPPATKQKLLAMLVKTQNIGPMGDEIAKLLDPPDDTQNALAQAQKDHAQSQEMIAELNTELQQLKLEKAGKVIENQSKEKIAAIDRLVKIELAEIETKAQDKSQRDELYAELVGKHHDAAHDVALQKDQQTHEHAIADKTAANAQVSQTEAQKHEAQLAKEKPAAGAKK